MWGLFVAELMGTLILVLLGNGVIANVVLGESKGKGSGWIVIATGWGLALAMGLYVAGWMTGGHLNPAVTIAFAVRGLIPWVTVIPYICGQLVGAFIGALLVYVAYLPHWGKSREADQLAAFATIPAIRAPWKNFLTEVIATAVLLLGIVAILNRHNITQMGLGALAVGFLLWAIGLGLGGPTGFAVNPARDLAPRIAHSILPMRGKGSSRWSYAWVPICGPIVGGLIGIYLYDLILLAWGGE